MRHNFAIEYNDLRICPMDETDSERYRQIRNADSKRIWFKNKEFISEKEQKKWFLSYLDNPSDCMFSVYNSLGEFMGGASLYNIEREHSCAEFGRLLLDELYSGRGIGRDIVLAICAVAKEQMGLRTLVLEVYENNYAAYYTYLKAGFEIQTVDRTNSLIQMVKTL